MSVVGSEIVAFSLQKYIRSVDDIDAHGPMTYKRAKSKITDDHVIAKQNIISRWSSSNAGDLSNVEPCRKCLN